MGKAISSIFGGGSKVDTSAQDAQLARIQKQEEEEQATLEARQRLLSGQQGRRRSATLFEETGEQGVKSTTLGG
jgi:Tfp pilus assembly protein PilN